MQVKQLHDWLAHWHEQFLDAGSKNKGKKTNDSGAKKAVLLSGTPGIGKTTSAKLVSQMLGFQTVEVGPIFLEHPGPSKHIIMTLNTLVITQIISICCLGKC